MDNHPARSSVPHRRASNTRVQLAQSSASVYSAIEFVRATALKTTREIRDAQCTAARIDKHLRAAHPGRPAAKDHRRTAMLEQMLGDFRDAILSIYDGADLLRQVTPQELDRFASHQDTVTICDVTGSSSIETVAKLSMRVVEMLDGILLSRFPNFAKIPVSTLTPIQSAKYLKLAKTLCDMAQLTPRDAELLIASINNVCAKVAHTLTPTPEYTHAVHQKSEPIPVSLEQERIVNVFKSNRNSPLTTDKLLAAAQLAVTGSNKHMLAQMVQQEMLLNIRPKGYFLTKRMLQNPIAVLGGFKNTGDEATKKS